MRIPIVGGTTASQSVVISSARAINCHVEQATQDAKLPIYLVGTPGAPKLVRVGTGPIRGELPMGDYLYVVSGNKLYRVNSAWAETELGTLNTSSGLVGIEGNGDQVMVVDGPYGYVYTLATGVFAQVTDADFPGATQMAYVDGYFLFLGSEDGIFRASDLYDGTAHDGLFFATAESKPDDATAIAADKGEAWIFGPYSAEAWINSPNGADFPFNRAAGGVVDAGIVAPRSLVRMNNTLYWLAQDDNGFLGLCALQGYQPVVVSSASVTEKIAGYAVKSDAFAWTYSRGRHQMYVLTFPTEGKTWVYDASIPEPELAWHEWHEFGLERCRFNAHAFFNGYHVVGDYENGDLYRLDWDAFTNDGDTIKRVRERGFSSGTGKNLRIKELEVQFEMGVGLASGQGSDPQVMLQISRDGGRTWGAEMWRSLGQSGRYRHRARWQQLGMGRDVVVRIAVTDPVRFRLLDAYAEVEELSH